MLPFIQFDPATFCLWIDLRSPRIVERESYSLLVNSLLFDENLFCEELARDLLEEGGEPEHESFSALLYSAFMHEKRHFLDYNLTNYGGFKHRFFLELYQNLPAIITYFKESGRKLLVPLHLNLDPVLCKIHDLPPLAHEIARAIEGYQGRLNMLREDARPHKVLNKKVTFGGEAQLEALAFLTQMVAAQRVYGPEHYRHWPESVRGNSRYTWILDYGHAAGLLDISKSGDFTVVDVTRCVPLLFASLQSRHWGQKPPNSEPNLAVWPGVRLAMFAQQLRENYSEQTRTSWDATEMWCELSQISAKIFGRTLEEEMDADVENAALSLEKIEKQYGSCNPLNQWTRLGLERRIGLQQEFRSNPEQILDLDTSIKGLVGKLTPYPLLCSKPGTFTEPPEKFQKIISYRGNYGSERHEVAWWWVTGPEKDSSSSVTGYGNAEIHADLASNYAPMAKFLIHGNRQRTMLGAELEIAHSHLVHKYGVDVHIDPIYGTHREKSEVESYFYLFAKGEKMMCDFCSNLVGVDEAELLSKWIFISNKINAEFLAEHFKNHPLGMIFLEKDWSEWLICHTCCSKLGIRREDIRTKAELSGFPFANAKIYPAAISLSQEVRSRAKDLRRGNVDLENFQDMLEDLQSLRNQIEL